MKNWAYTINEVGHPHNGTTLWSGRYCATTGIVHRMNDKNEFEFLIVKRNKGAADFQGKWCCPCGFLERDEKAEEGVLREVYEETGYRIDIKNSYPMLFSVETDPSTCNNGNVTLRYIINVTRKDLEKDVIQDTNEIAEVKWIHQNEIDEFDFAFGHDKMLKEFIVAFGLPF